MTTLVLQLLFAGVGSVLFFVFLGLAYRTINAERTTYNQNRLDVGSFSDALRGNATSHGAVSGYKIREGLAIDTKRRKVVAQGTLSDDAINAILK